MKTIGLLGGTSWESTAIYYRQLNEMARERKGGLSSAQLLLWSFDFAPLAKLMAEDRWAELAALMVDAAHRLERGGADALILCANTMHKIAPEVEAATKVPLLHIADATAMAIKQSRSSYPLLLATRFVMERDFYKDRLKDRHGIEAAIPGDEDRAFLHKAIFDELCQGIVKPETRETFLDVIRRAQKEQHIDGVILGCTEFGLLAGQSDFDIPVFDTALIHAKAAIDFALG
jgi:aspartate racemase